MQTKQSFNKITCFGAGFVGTPTTAVLALKNPNIKFYVFDINKSLIDQWNNGYPIHQEGLQQIVEKVRNINLFFTNDIQLALQDVDVIYIAVATPTKTFGQGKDKYYDLSYIESVARSISYFFKNIQLKKQLIVIQKSTVPVFTHQAVSDILRQNQIIQSNKDKFIVISNPQFLSQGTTVRDILYPDRVVYGSSNRQDLINKLSLLHPHVPNQKIIKTSTINSQLTKLVSNCFLAQRISSINTISMLIQHIGGDIGQLKQCVGADSRIGNKFINPSVGFGGSCLKKDVLALVYLAESNGLTEVAEYWKQVIVVNEYRKKSFFSLILSKMHTTIRNKKFSILGLSFKKGTNDVRDSAAGKVCQLLLQEGAILQIYDPMIKKQKFIEELKYQRMWKNEYADRLIEMKSVSDSIEDTHAIVILTQWDEFINEDYASFFKRMHKPSYIFDGRNILNQKQIIKIGFKYFRIGHKH